MTFTASKQTAGTNQQLGSSVTVPILVANVNRPPVITPISNLTVRRGEVLELNVRATDLDVEPLIATAASALPGFPLPRFATFTDTGEGTGTFRFEPGVGDSGNYPLQFSVTDSGAGDPNGVPLSSAFTFVLTVVADNEPPTLSFVGDQVAIVGTPFTLTVQSQDYDQELLQYALSGLPGAATLASTNVFGQALLTWTPTQADLGNHQATITVTDRGNGNSALVASASKQFQVKVVSSNSAPSLEVVPAKSVQERQRLQFAISAQDPGDPITYTAQGLPDGAILNPQTGAFDWTPRQGQAGNYSFSVTASDGSRSASTPVTIAVAKLDTLPLLAPVARQLAREGSLLQFTVAGADPDGDAVVLSVQSTIPAGASFNPATGIFRWIPGFDQSGDHTVTFSIRDSHNNVASTNVQIHVDDVRRPPVMNSTSHSARLGQPLTFRIIAQNPDTDSALSFSANHLPEGAVVDTSTGLVRWTPGPGQAGDYIVTLRAANGPAVATQDILIRASLDPIPPAVTIALTPSFPVVPGSPVSIHVAASSLAAISQLQLTVNGQPTALNAQGIARITPANPGKITIVATAIDSDALVGQATSEIKVLDPANSTAPVVSIDPLSIAGQISVPAVVAGTVRSTNLDFWRLEIAPLGSDQIKLLGSGGSAVESGALSVLDPATLPNGFYSLRLTAEDIASRHSQTEVTVEINSASKPFAYRASEVDISTTLNGIAVQVVRRYDSLNGSTSGEFGNGWTWMPREVNLQTNARVTGRESLGIFAAFQSDTRVYLTLPNGQRSGFTFAPQMVQLPGLTYFLPAWQSDAGVPYTLSSVDAHLTRAGGHFYDLGTGQPYNPANPFFGDAGYTLTATDGTRYRINAQRGIVEQITPGGGTLYFSDSGITALNGQAIEITRDAQGRITCIDLPDGTDIQYSYDDEGNLAAVTNGRSGQSRQYGYDPNSPGRLRLAVRNDGNSQWIEYGQTPSVVPLPVDLGSVSQFSGQSQPAVLPFQTRDMYAFHVSAEELASAAAGELILRVEVRGTAAVTVPEGTIPSLVPGTPVIEGLQLLSIANDGQKAVALFSVRDAGVYAVQVRGANAEAGGNYEIELSIAGDVNLDARVDGTDSQLLAAVLDVVSGPVQYDPAVDVNGDNLINANDRQVLIENYGFVAETIESETPPSSPLFNLEPSFDTSPVGDSRTTHSSVTLVGRTDPDTTVQLQQTGETFVVGCTGLFYFDEVPLAVGDNTFTVTARAFGGLTSEATVVIHRGGVAVSTTAPTIAARLVLDTANPLDGISSNVTVGGTIAHVGAITAFRASVDGSPLSSVLSSLTGDQFTLSRSLLETIHGSPLTDGTHTVRLSAIDEFGNRSSITSLSFVLDTTASPVPAQPELVSPTGPGNLTNDTTPSIRVKGPTGNNIRLYRDGIFVNQLFNASGEVIFNIGPLANGSHSLTAEALDPAGNASAMSTALTITVDTQKPLVPTLDLAASSDSLPLGDRTTNLELVTLTGKTNPGLSVTLRRATTPETPIAFAIANETGDFSFASIALASGPNGFRVVATSAAGNSSFLDRTFTSTAVDTTGPAIHAALSRDTGRDSGDGLTFDGSIEGFVDDASQVVSLEAAIDGRPAMNLLPYLEQSAFRLTVADLQLLNGAAISQGEHTLQLQARDQYGNAASPTSLSFRLDTTRPLPPALSLLAADDTGRGSHDQFTAATTLRIDTVGESDSRIRLFLDGNEVGQTITNGAHQFLVNALTDGQHTFTAIVEDRAGNTSVFSEPVLVTVKTTPPSQPVFDLAAASDTRPYGDHATNLPNVRLVGRTDPNAVIKIMESNEVVVADSNGNFSFYPISLESLGQYSFTMQAEDLAGNRSTFARTITRNDTPEGDLLRPNVTLTVSQSVTLVGTSITITVSAADNVSVATTRLFVAGEPITLDSNNRATYTSATPRIVEVVATALDPSGNEGHAKTELKYLVPPVAGQTLPFAALTDPIPNPIATMPLDVRGTATSEALLRYTLEHSIQGQNNWVRFASGTTEITDGPLGTFDPTQLENGYYDVRLVVEDTSGNIATATRVYSVQGQAKIGNFTLTFNDMMVPLPGISLTATRMYDSRTRQDQGDFGNGWSYSTSSIKVSKSSVLGDGFIQTQTIKKPDPREILQQGLFGGGIFGVLQAARTTVTYTFQNTQNDEVDITLPDGTVQRFLMGFSGITYSPSGPPLDSTRIFYTPVPGTGNLSTLEALTNNDVIVSPARVGEVQFIDRTTGEVYNPTRWKLTTPDGIQYIIDESNGIESVTDIDGNTVSITDDAQSHSAGLGLSVIRDVQGRITSLTDPLNGRVQYGYDTYGDLVTVTDQLGHVTRFTYDNDHRLLEVHDPLGRRGARSDYDETGRLISTTDAAGYQAVYEHDLPGRRELTRDRLGHLTVHHYDEAGRILSQTNALGGVTSNTYDSHGNHLSVTDPNGNTINYTYTANHQLASLSDPMGHTVRFTYDSAGRLLTQTDPRGNAVAHRYDSKGRLIETKDALGNTVQFTYDSRGRQTALIDTMGNSHISEYDPYGREIKHIDANGNATTYTYDLLGNVLSTTRTRANLDGAVQQVVTTQAYNAKGQATTIVDELGNVSHNVFDPLGRLTNKVRGTTTTLTDVYDARGNLVRTVLPDGAIETRTYDANGNITKSVDRYGGVTTYQYDALGRLTSVQQPSGASISHEYDAAGREIASTDANGNRVTKSYDDGIVFVNSNDVQNRITYVGRLTEIKSDTGESIRFTYDANGNRLSQQDFDGATMSYQYDALNRQTAVMLPDDSIVRQEFNALGLPASATDNEGRVTRRSYDKMGRLISVTSPDGQVSRFAYDSLGNQLSVEVGEGNTTAFEYDEAGRLTREILPSGKSKSIVWTDDHVIARRTDFNGNVTTYEYDEFSRPILTRYHDGTTVARTYVGFATIASLTNEHGTTEFTYDVKGRVTQVSSPEGVVEYEYNARAQRTAIITAAGTIAYEYNSRGQLMSVTSPSGEITEYTYTSLGQIKTTRYPNGVTAAYSYSSAGELQVMETRSPSGELLQKLTYTYTDSGLKASETDHTGRVVQYQYDANRRLVEEKITGSGQGDNTIRYTYDERGNRLTKQDRNGTVSYTYDADGRLVQEGSATYTYDANGNRLSRVDGNQTVTYEYDAQNRLTKETVNGSVVEYTYDAEGHLVARTVDGVTTRFIIGMTGNYSHVLAEMNSTGVITANYVYANDVPISVTRNGSTFYYVQDGLGSTRALTNSDGVVSDRYLYDAFGSLLQHAGSAANTLLYTGELADIVTGNYYLRARFYDPATGTFLTRDTFNGVPTEPASLNHYSYANQNPLTFTDPSGHFAMLGLLAVVGLPFVFIGAMLTGIAGAGLAVGGAAAEVITPLFNAFNVGATYAQIRGISAQDKSGGLGLGAFSVVGLEVGFFVGSPAAFGVAYGYGGSVEAAYLGKQDDWYFFGSHGAQWGFAWGVNPYLTYNAGMSVYAGFGFGAWTPEAYEGQSMSTTVSFGPVSLTWGANVPLRSGNTSITIGVSPTDIALAAISSAANYVAGASTFSLMNTTRDVKEIKVPHHVRDAMHKARAGVEDSPEWIPRYMRDFIIFFNGYDNPQLPNMFDYFGSLRASSESTSEMLADGVVTVAAAADVIDAARRTWQTALPNVPAIDVDVRFEDLPAGELGQAHVTRFDTDWRPAAGVVILDPDANGHGWFIDPTPDDHAEFLGTLSSTTFAAEAGKEHADKYDMYSVLLHEMGHLIGFSESNAAFDHRITNLADKPHFVADGLIATLSDGSHIDGQVHPHDLMSDSLEPGVRKLPSALDIQILLAALEPVVLDSDVVSAPSSGVRYPQTSSAARRDFESYGQNSNVTSQAVPSGTAVTETILLNAFGVQRAPEMLVVANAQADGNERSASDYRGSLHVAGHAAEDLFDPTLPNSGWTVMGGATISGNAATLNEDSQVLTSITREITIPADATALQFTITQLGLVDNGDGQPPDAFEVALLDATTFESLVGTSVGLTSTDSLLNIQQTGEVFFSPRVSFAGAGTSGQATSLTTPLVITVDLQGVTAGTQAKLYFDLLGFGAVSSSVQIASIQFLGIGGNHAPNAIDDVGITNENSVLVVNAAGILANDTDVDAGDSKAVSTVNGQAVGAEITLASGARLTVQSDGSYRYDPNGKFENLKPGQSANDSFTYQMMDSAGATSSATVTITIQGANDTVVATNDHFNTLQSTPVTISAPGLLANDSDPDGDALTASKLTDPTNGTLTVNSDGGFTYNPSAGFVGVDSFIYRASDGIDSQTATVTITVSAPAAPVLNPDNYTTAEDSPMNVSAAAGVLANDVSPSGVSLAGATVITGPLHGTLTLNSNGSFSYVPAENYFGQDSFTYRAQAGSTNSSNVGTVSISVLSENDLPIAVADSITTSEDQPVTILAPGVLANDTDADVADTLRVLAINGQTSAIGTTFTLESGAQLLMQPNGGFTYDPHGAFNSLRAGQSGQDSFTYSMRDSAGAVASATVTVLILPVHEPNSIAGSVYVDVNNDGIRGSQELGLPRVYVRLEGPVHRSARTDDNGNYHFDDLPSGTYTVWEYHPQSFIDGIDSRGTPSLGTVSQDRFVGIALTGNVHATNYNFGERGLRSVDKRLELASTPIRDVLMAIMAIDEPSSLEAQFDPPTANARHAFHNDRNPRDVTDDGFVTPLDALLIINTLNAMSFGDPIPPGAMPRTIPSAPYYDTNADGQITPNDVLLVFNYLNAQGAGEGEAEGLALWLPEDEEYEESEEIWSELWSDPLELLPPDFSTDRSNPLAVPDSEFMDDTEAAEVESLLEMLAADACDSSWKEDF